MKKTISWFSAAALGLSLLIPQFSIHAWGPISVAADNTDLSSGGKVTITCNLPDNSGFNGFDITVDFPESKLTMVDMTTGSTYENAYLKNTKDKIGKVGIMVVNKEAIAEGEDVFTVTFEAVRGAMGSAVINITGDCTRPDTTSEDFGQVFTISLPLEGGKADTSTPKPIATAAPTAAARNSTGGGGGSSSASATAAPTAAPTATPKPTAKPTAKPNIEPINFTDISGHWASDSILSLAGQGFINGFDDNTFRPEENVTRAQFIKMLAEVKGLDTSMSLDVFDDVDAKAWYAPYVTAAAANGIVQGDDDNKFNPDSHITRQEMAVMCARAFSMNESSDIRFSDDSEIADWAKTSVSALVSENIINGFDEDNTFRPAANTTRAQAAVVLERLAGR